MSVIKNRNNRFNQINTEPTGFQGGNVVYGIFYYFSLDIESRKFHPEIL